MKSVLFCCDYNSARSAMAQGIIQDWYSGSPRTASAGLQDDQLVNGYAISAMQELNIDISNHQPQLLRDLHDTPFDLIISLTEHSNIEAQKLPWADDAIIEHWNLPDPVNEALKREEQLDAFRKTRDILMKLILARFALPLTDDDSDYLHDYFGKIS